MFRPKISNPSPQFQAKTGWQDAREEHSGADAHVQCSIHFDVILAFLVHEVSSVVSSELTNTGKVWGSSIQRVPCHTLNSSPKS